MLQPKGFRKKIEVKSIPLFQAEGYSIPTFQWYEGAMLAILGDLSVSNKDTKLKTNVNSNCCLISYINCYATDSVQILTGAPVQ